MARIQVLLATSLFLVVISLFLVHHSTGFSLKLIPRSFLESPFYSRNLTQMEQATKLIEFLQARAGYLDFISNPIAAMDPNNIRFTMNRFDITYAVKVYIGARKDPQMLAIDTASGLIWTQCHPCIHCFNQTDLVYNSTRSSTYRKLPSLHPACLPPYKRAKGDCVYNLKYGSNASTSGFFSLEKFWFLDKIGFSTKGDMIFGCSNDNRRIRFEYTRRISGVLGMSRSSESFVKQLDNSINGRFSYCMYGGKGITAPTGVLSFGKDITIPITALTTPFVPDNKTHHYYLNLLDISVAGSRLQFARGTFSLGRGRTGGCIISIQSLSTYIVPHAFNRVIAAFETYFRPFKLQKHYTAKKKSELCYELDQNFTAFPSMTYHFQGADLFVKPNYAHFIIHDTKIFCVAVERGNTKTVLGIWQQQDTRFFYDNNRNVLQFAPENC